MIPNWSDVAVYCYWMFHHYREEIFIGMMKT